MKSSKRLPSVKDVRRTMRNLAMELYSVWRRELRDRILNLEFEGYIAKDHINVNSAVWRLPNSEIRFALDMLKSELDNLGYDYEFKFEDVDDVTFILLYSITLPEEDEEDEEDYSDFETDDSSSSCSSETSTSNSETTEEFDDKHVHVVAASTNHVDTEKLIPGSTLDGIVLQHLDTVLLKDQKDGITNGLYVITPHGAKLSYEVTLEILTVFVSNGEVNKNTGWISGDSLPPHYEKMELHDQHDHQDRRDDDSTVDLPSNIALPPSDGRTAEETDETDETDETPDNKNF